MSIGCLSFKVLEQTIFQYKNNFYRETATLFDRKGRAGLEEERLRASEEAFEQAFLETQNQFSTYLDVTGLNVKDKTEIHLTRFNPNYVPPTYSELLQNAYVNMQNSFDNNAKAKFNAIASENKYVRNLKMLSLNGFSQLDNLTISNLDIDNGVPYSVNHLNLNEISDLDPIQQIGALLLSTGLATGVICAIVGAAGLLIATAPVAWFLPYSVPATVAALITIAGILLLYWDVFSNILWRLCELFVMCISALADHVISFFNWIVGQAQTSVTVGETAESGYSDGINNGKKYIPEVDKNQLIHFTNTALIIAMIKEVLEKGNQYCSVLSQIKDNHFILSYPFVTVDEAIDMRMPLDGWSTWILFQHNAIRILVEGGTGFVGPKYEQHSNSRICGLVFKHYHMYEYNETTGVYKKTENPNYKFVHSFFDFPVNLMLPSTSLRSLIDLITIEEILTADIYY